MKDLMLLLDGNEGSIKQSILNHLQTLLNTRQGSLVHLPKYGLPEFPIHLGLNAAKKFFVQSLKEVITLFEPRILALTIKEISENSLDSIVTIVMHASLANDDVIPIETVVLNDLDILVRDPV